MLWIRCAYAAEMPVVLPRDFQVKLNVRLVLPSYLRVHKRSCAFVCLGAAKSRPGKREKNSTAPRMTEVPLASDVRRCRFAWSWLLLIGTQHRTGR